MVIKDIISGLDEEAVFCCLGTVQYIEAYASKNITEFFLKKKGFKKYNSVKEDFLKIKNLKEDLYKFIVKNKLKDRGLYVVFCI